MARRSNLLTQILCAVENKHLVLFSKLNYRSSSKPSSAVCLPVKLGRFLEMRISKFSLVTSALLVHQLLLILTWVYDAFFFVNFALLAYNTALKAMQRLKSCYKRIKMSSGSEKSSKGSHLFCQNLPVS